MKKLIFVNGTMGSGKTAVCQKLKEMLSPCAFLDGDWCWDMSPFQVTDETRQMVIKNIRFLLRQFLDCSAFDTVLFCWVMQEEAIIGEIVKGLDLDGVAFHRFTLMAEEETLRHRLRADVENGLRRLDVIERSLARLPLYQNQNTIKIQTDHLTVEETARQIAWRIKG